MFTMQWWNFQIVMEYDGHISNPVSLLLKYFVKSAISKMHYDLLTPGKKISPRLWPLSTRCDVFLDSCDANSKIYCIEYFSSKIAWFFHHLVLAFLHYKKLIKNDLLLKNQAIFEEKYSMQYILLLASQESRKMSHWAGWVHNGGEIFVFPVDHSAL